MERTTTKIKGWAVCYIPTKQGRTFAALQNETMANFKSQLDAIAHCDSLNLGGYIDEMHIGYRVQPIYN